MQPSNSGDLMTPAGYSQNCTLFLQVTNFLHHAMLPHPIFARKSHPISECHDAVSSPYSLSAYLTQNDDEEIIFFRLSPFAFNPSQSPRYYMYHGMSIFGNMSLLLLVTLIEPRSSNMRRLCGQQCESRANPNSCHT